MCKLCRRETPFYFNNQEANHLQNIPDRSLTQFLKDMRTHVKSESKFLSLLKVSAKFVKACDCQKKDKHVHAYCLTAFIIHNKKSYCEKCRFHYNLFIKQEKFCTTKVCILFVKFFFLLILLAAMSVGLVVLDAYLKMTKYHKNTQTD